tara:strand:- start:29602 stop:30615 length:1014 start_codon:yes stop_codon:yes gene_type:complete
MPILDNVLFTMDKGILRLEATDLEMRSIIEMPISVKTKFSVCVPYQLLVSTLKGFPNAPVELEFANGLLIIRSTESTVSNGKYEIPTEKPEDFPANKFEFTGEKISFNALDFVEAIKKASNHIDANNINGMQNLLIHVKEDAVKVVGGTGFLIYEHSIKGQGIEKKLLISMSVVKYLTSTITEECELEMSYTDNHIFFALEGRQIGALLCDANYPDYERLFNAKNTDKTYKVEPDILFPALKRICNLTDKNSNVVAFDFKGETLEMIFNHSAQKCNANEIVKTDYEGEPLKLGFIANQLNGCLRLLDGPIVLEMSLPNKGAFITADNARAIVMPAKP